MRKNSLDRDTQSAAIQHQEADDRGSLIILVLCLFTILLTASLALIDISDNFLAKRQLVEIGEVAITRAAHQISLTRYYSGNILMDNSGADGSQFRIPIDCGKAFISFSDEISASNLRGRPVLIESWNCSNDQVTATLSVELTPLIKIPLITEAGNTDISVTVAATSIIGGIRG